MLLVWWGTWYEAFLLKLSSDPGDKQDQWIERTALGWWNVTAKSRLVGARKFQPCSSPQNFRIIPQSIGERSGNPKCQISKWTAAYRSISMLYLIVDSREWKHPHFHRKPAGFSWSVFRCMSSCHRSYQPTSLSLVACVYSSKASSRAQNTRAKFSSWTHNSINNNRSYIFDGVKPVRLYFTINND